MLGLGPLAKPLGPSVPLRRLLPMALELGGYRSLSRARCSAGFSSLLALVTEGTVGAALPDMASRVACSFLGGSKAALLRWPWASVFGSWFSWPGLRLASKKRGVLMHIHSQRMEEIPFH